jgi:hypothetical protein
MFASGSLERFPCASAAGSTRYGAWVFERWSTARYGVPAGTPRTKSSIAFVARSSGAPSCSCAMSPRSLPVTHVSMPARLTNAPKSWYWVFCEVT